MYHRTWKAVALCALVGVYLVPGCIPIREVPPEQRVREGIFQVRAREAAPPYPSSNPVPKARNPFMERPDGLPPLAAPPVERPPGVLQPRDWSADREPTLRGGPVGTAFQITERDFVTAAHVLANFMDSRFSTPVLVDSESQYTYPIDSVERYDEVRDIAVIRLKWPRPPPRKLSVNLVFDQVGAPVRFAGYAQLERPRADGYDGTVIFDRADPAYSLDDQPRGFQRLENGLLHFGPIPTRGVSGGPLFDTDLKVIGMVVSANPPKSAGAIPIKDVLEFIAEGGEQAHAVARSHNLYSTLSAFECDQPIAELKTDIALPLPFDALSAAIKDFKRKHIAKTIGQELQDEIDRTSSRPAAEADRCDTSESSDGKWGLYSQDAGPQSSRRLDAVVIRGLPKSKAGRRAFTRHRTLSASSQQELARSAYEHPRMNELLANRHPEGEVDKPLLDELFVDGWKRVWLLRQWQLPHDELVIISLAREVRGGYLVVMRAVSTGAADACTARLKMITMTRDLSCPRPD